jgi:adenylate kinase
VQKRQASGRDLLLPKEIIFLLGAPGSGKGTHSASIMEQRGITAEPIVMSNLLISPESKTAKDEGKLVADAYVLERILTEMVSDKYQSGCIIDGFPRNLLQV